MVAKLKIIFPGLLSAAVMAQLAGCVFVDREHHHEHWHHEHAAVVYIH